MLELKQLVNTNIMKRIQLIHYESPDPESNRTERKRFYRAYIGNGYRVKFKSQKDIEKFLVDASSFCTEQMHELNFIYGELFVLFRGTWPYLGHDKKSSKLPLRQIQNICEREFDSIQSKFNLMVDRASFTNGNAFVFTHLQSVISSMDQVAVMLIDQKKSRSAGVETRKLKSIRSRMAKISYDLNKYGYEKATNPRPEDVHLKVVKTLAAG